MVSPDGYLETIFIRHAIGFVHGLQRHDERIDGNTNHYFLRQGAFAEEMQPQRLNIIGLHRHIGF
jgi:hypothetical protein